MQAAPVSFSVLLPPIAAAVELSVAGGGVIVLGVRGGRLPAAAAAAAAFLRRC